MNAIATIVSKVSSFCTTLRVDERSQIHESKKSARNKHNG